MDSSPETCSPPGHDNVQLSPEYDWTPHSPSLSPALMYDNSSSDAPTMPSEPESQHLFDSPRSPSPSYQADSDSNPIDWPQPRALSQSFLLDWRYPLMSDTNRSDSATFPRSPVRMDSPAYLEVEEDVPLPDPPLSPYHPSHSPSSIHARLGSPWAQHPDLANASENRSMSPVSDMDRPFSPLDLIVNDQPATDGRAQFDHSYVRQQTNRMLEAQIDDSARRARNLEGVLQRMRPSRLVSPSPRTRSQITEVSLPDPELVSMRMYSPSPSASDSMGSMPNQAAPLALGTTPSDSAESTPSRTYVVNAFGSQERWNLDNSGPIPVFRRAYSPASPAGNTEPESSPTSQTARENVRRNALSSNTPQIRLLDRVASAISSNRAATPPSEEIVPLYRYLRSFETQRNNLVAGPARFDSPMPDSPQQAPTPPLAQPRYDLRSRGPVGGGSLQARARALSPEVREPVLRFDPATRRTRPRTPSPDEGTERNQRAQPQRGVIVSNSPNNATSFMQRLRRARNNVLRLGSTSVTPVRIQSPPVRASAVLRPLPEPVSLNNSTKKKISSKVKETMAKVGIDDGQARTSRALTPDPCSVCLDVPKGPEASLTYPCLHTFCNECISVWVKTKSSCPNCQAKVTRILYNIRGESDYDVKGVEDCNNLMTAPPFEGDFFELFLHLHQRVANHTAEFRPRQPPVFHPVREAYQVSEVYNRNIPDLPNALNQERIFPGVFEVSRVNFRRAVYAQRLIGGERGVTLAEAQATEIPGEIGGATINRDGYIRLLRPWLRREAVAVILPELSNTVREHFFAVVSSHMSHPTNYEAFAVACREWLTEGRERIFWREMMQFISRRLEMGVWDQNRSYFKADGTLYDPAHRQRTESDEDVQVVNVVLRDPRRSRRNVELIVVDSDDDVSVSTNGGRTIDSTRATNGTADSDREMNWLPSETDTDATGIRENWERRHEEVETSDYEMDVDGDSRSRAQSSRRRDTPDPRSPSEDRSRERTAQHLTSRVVHLVNSYHSRRQRRPQETRQLHRQESSRPVRSSTSRSAAERRRSARHGRSTTTSAASRSSRVRHGHRAAVRSGRPSRTREDEDMDTDGEEDHLPIPIRPPPFRRSCLPLRTPRGDSPDPRPRSYSRSQRSDYAERHRQAGRLRSGGSRRSRSRYE